MSANFDVWGAHTEFEEKALHEESDYWRLTGYAATFNDVDRVNDAIVPGAFKKCLDRMQQKGETLQLYLNHKLDIPIGDIASVVEDRKGLKYEAHLPKDDTLVSGRVVPQIKRRSLRSNSFGYKVRESERRKSDNVRLLKCVDIFEISVVGMPANPAANIEGIKGVIPFQDLPIDTRSTTWDQQAAIKRLQVHFNCVDGPNEEYRSAFLFVDEAKADEWDAYRLPIADVDDAGRLVANRVAIMKSVAAISGARKGDLLPEEAESAVRDTLERYYQRLNLDAPFTSMSVTEWKALDAGERKARLQDLGLSRSLAAELAGAQLNRSAGADRNPSQTQVGSTEDVNTLLTALGISALRDLAAQINAPK